MKTNHILVRDDPKLPDDSEEVSKPIGVVGDSIPDCEIVSLLDGKQPGGQALQVSHKSFM